MPSFANFMHTQLILKIPQPSVSFDTATVIITGASSGLGKEAAKHIVRLGASKVILGCRNIAKGTKTKIEIESALKCKTGIIEVWEVDLESPPSIKAFVDRANQLRRLDVLVNNAGIKTMKHHVIYGTERNIAVNVIGTFLLALQLIPKLKETAKTYGVSPHMTFVGSALYDVAKYPDTHGQDIFDWYSDKAHVVPMDQYNVSKLLLLYVIVKLASIIDPGTSDRCPDSNPIVINSLDPCFCKTELAGEFTGGLKAMLTIFEFLFARSAEEGSRLVVTAASAGRETHGGYMRAGSLEAYAPIITNDGGVKRSEYVWEVLGKHLEQLQPGILDNVNIV